MATINLPGLLQMLVGDYKSAQKKRETRYTEGMGILENIVNMFGPGYLKGEEKKMLASMEQGMVGRGLGGTTRPAAVGTGIKADIRDRQTQARAGAMTNIASFMSGFEEGGPSAGTLAHLATGGFSAMGNLQTTTGNTLGPMASQGLDVFGKPLSGSLAEAQMNAFNRQGLDSGGGGGGMATGGGGGGMATGGGWQPGGIPSNTGAGAATYGVGGGMETGNLISDAEWADIQAKVGTMSGPTRNIPAITDPAKMDEFQKTYTPQTGDISAVPAGGGGFAAWLKAQGKGATASTIMQWERQKSA